MSQTAMTWAMSLGFLGSFLLTGYHAHVLLHLGLGYTLVAMFSFVGAVLAGLLLNLWFMAGQRYVLEFLAWYEPTSCMAEWVHDTVFGISQDRIDAAYQAGSHSGRCVQGRTLAGDGACKMSVCTLRQCREQRRKKCRHSPSRFCEIKS